MILIFILVKNYEVLKFKAVLLSNYNYVKEKRKLGIIKNR